MPDDQRQLSAEKCKDAGLALVLLALLGYQAWPRPPIMLLAVVCLLAAMTFPSVFRPFARVWFALSALLGTVMSRLLLTVLFFAMVLPVGLLRRALGKDTLQIKNWRQGRGSVFRTREHEFSAQDLEHPY